jgi:hypothetical protein
LRVQTNVKTPSGLPQRSNFVQKQKQYGLFIYSPRQRDQRRRSEPTTRETKKRNMNFSEGFRPVRTNQTHLLKLGRTGASHSNVFIAAATSPDFALSQ